MAADARPGARTGGARSPLTRGRLWLAPELPQTSFIRRRDGRCGLWGLEYYLPRSAMLSRAKAWQAAELEALYRSSRF